MNLLSSPPLVLAAAAVGVEPVAAAVLAAQAEPAQEQVHPAEVEPGVPAVAALEAVGVEEAPAGGAVVEMETFLVFQKILHHPF